MMNQLRSRINRLLETDSVRSDEERDKLRVLLTTKRFNPYCLRHSSISHDSDFLPDYPLKKKVRWSMNSKQPSRYIKAKIKKDLIIDGENKKEHEYLIPKTKINRYGDNEVYFNLSEESLKEFEI